MAELRECPFCGGLASVVKRAGTEVYNQTWSVGCTKCSVQMTERGSNSWNANEAEDAAAEALAVRRWNKRADDPRYTITPAGAAMLERSKG